MEQHHINTHDIFDLVVKDKYTASHIDFEKLCDAVNLPYTDNDFDRQKKELFENTLTSYFILASYEDDSLEGHKALFMNDQPLGIHITSNYSDSCDEFSFVTKQSVMRLRDFLESIVKDKPEEDIMYGIDIIDKDEVFLWYDHDSKPYGFRFEYNSQYCPSLHLPYSYYHGEKVVNIEFLATDLLAKEISITLSDGTEKTARIEDIDILLFIKQDQ